jgi:hypothetical protein
MPASRPTNGSSAPKTGEEERKLVERVAQRVYELWREELRREQERRGRRIRR